MIGADRKVQGITGAPAQCVLLDKAGRCAELQPQYREAVTLSVADTLCSQSADIELTRVGLSFRAAVEQFRQQVQNIE